MTVKVVKLSFPLLCWRFGLLIVSGIILSSYDKLLTTLVQLFNDRYASKASLLLTISRAAIAQPTASLIGALGTVIPPNYAPFIKWIFQHLAVSTNDKRVLFLETLKEVFKAECCLLISFSSLRKVIGLLWLSKYPLFWPKLLNSLNWSRPMNCSYQLWKLRIFC